MFVKVLNGEFEFTDELHERKWLTVTAINLCKDRLKSWKRKAVVAIDDEPEQAAPEKEDYSEVTEAVKKLPVKLKDVIWLFYYEGYQTDEIAQVDFTYGGKSYTLRASKQSGDFSGINGTLIKSDKIDAQTDAVLETIRGFEYNYFKLKWTDGAVTFILSNNSETTTESVIEIYEKIK